MAGVEVEKTNRLLNELAKCVQDKKPFLEAVDKVKKGQKPPAGAGAQDKQKDSAANDTQKTKTSTTTTKTTKPTTNKATPAAGKTTNKVAAKKAPASNKQAPKETKPEPVVTKEPTPPPPETTTVEIEEKEDEPAPNVPEDKPKSAMKKSNTFSLSKEDKLDGDIITIQEGKKAEEDITTTSNEVKDIETTVSAAAAAAVDDVVGEQSSPRPSTQEISKPSATLNLDIDDDEAKPTPPPPVSSNNAVDDDLLGDLSIEEDDNFVPSKPPEPPKKEETQVDVPPPKEEPKINEPIKAEEKVPSTNNIKQSARTRMKSSKTVNNNNRSNLSTGQRVHHPPTSAAAMTLTNTNETRPAAPPPPKPEPRPERTMSRTRAPPPSAMVPHSARPSSSRPAPPRVMTSKALGRVLESRLEIRSGDNAPDNVEPSNAMLPQEDDEEGDEYVISSKKLQHSLFDEVPPEQSTNHSNLKGEDKNKGKLVQQLVQTKANLEGASNDDDKQTNGSEDGSQQPPSDSRALRAQVQQLCQSIGSLSKALEYLHEDIDPIMLEQTKWREEFHRCLGEMVKLNADSQHELEPLGKELEQLEIENKSMEERLAMIKANVYRNNQAIVKMMEKI